MLERSLKEFGMLVSDVTAQCAGMFGAIGVTFSNEHLPLQLPMLGDGLRDKVAALPDSCRPSPAAIIALSMYYMSNSKVTIRGQYDCRWFDKKKFGELLIFLLNTSNDRMRDTDAVIGEVSAFCNHFEFPHFLHSHFFAAKMGKELLICFMCALVMNDIITLDNASFRELNNVCVPIKSQERVDRAIQLFLVHPFEMVQVYKLVVLEIMINEAVKMEVHLS